MTDQTTEGASDYSAPSAAALLTPREAAAIVGLNQRTLARMADRGSLSRVQPTGSRHRRYLRHEIVALTTPAEATPHASAGSTSDDAA